MAESPNPAAPERDPYEDDEPEAPVEYDLEALRARGDVDGLLVLAKAYRSGSAPGGRDLGKCLSAYRAAAVLGSGEAEYAVSLFLMNGGPVVAQDLKEGTMRLRSAAEKGSIPAKIYLGNLYELGIHYKADAEKADVWYRNAARTSKIDGEPGSEASNRALADLGAARYVLALGRDPAVPEGEKQRLMARAKAHGLGLRIRDGSEGDRATFEGALAGAESRSAVPAGPAMATAAPRPAPVVPAASKATVPNTKEARLAQEAKGKTPAPIAAPIAAKPAIDPAAKAAADRIAKKKAADRSTRLAGAFGAFGYALLFIIAGVGAGYAATLGARELVAHGHLLPLLGARTHLVFPIMLVLVGVLPTWLVYRFGTMLKALIMGAAVAGIGWVAWGTGRGAYHHDRPMQALAFGLAGFLAGLLVLGLLGGAKSASRVARRPPG